jgi:Chromosome segregation ATPases
MKTRTILGILAALLFLFLLGTAFWGFGLKTEKEKLLSEKADLAAEIGTIESLKLELEAEVDSLDAAYNFLAEENESLQESLKSEKARVRRRDQRIKSISTALSKEQTDNRVEVGDLRSQIQGLLASKTALESSIFSLRSENDSLRNLTVGLTKNLGKAREDNLALANLNRSMEGELDRLTLANFKASAFNVEFLKKNNKKVTAKSRRARRAKVSFDLTNVPQEYQGVRPVYLVITDEKATPIKLKEPIQAQVIVNGQTQNIMAAEAKEINVQKSQRISFTHDLDEKLGSGYYRISVYTDIGLLGATNFRLR